MVGKYRTSVSEWRDFAWELGDLKHPLLYQSTRNKSEHSDKDSLPFLDCSCSKNRGLTYQGRPCNRCIFRDEQKTGG